MCAVPHIGLLKHLTELHIQNNSISILDDRLGFCVKLRVLDISNNSITSLPNTMYGHSPPTAC